MEKEKHIPNTAPSAKLITKTIILYLVYLLQHVWYKAYVSCSVTTPTKVTREILCKLTRVLFLSDLE